MQTVHRIEGDATLTVAKQVAQLALTQKACAIMMVTRSQILG